MSNFSYSHSVFKRLVLQTCKNWACLGKGRLLPKGKILEVSELKAFADNNQNMTQQEHGMQVPKLSCGVLDRR